MTSTNDVSTFDTSKTYYHFSSHFGRICTIKKIEYGKVYYKCHFTATYSSGEFQSDGVNPVGIELRLATEDEIRKANRGLQDLGFGYRFPANKPYEPWYDVF